MSGHAVDGQVADGFEQVKDRFAALVEAEGGDLCAQLAAFHRGELVVDLWSGAGCDALQGIYSATKGVTHIVVALLVQDGVLDLDVPVSRYWPEFASHGKGQLLLRELLSHQAGVVGVADGFSLDELADDAVVAERLAAQRPFWRPGAGSGYHALVMGALSAEVVRRVTGRTVQQLFVELLQVPLGLDLFLGLPPDQEDRFLTAQPLRDNGEHHEEALAAAPDSLPGIAFNRHAPESVEVWELPNHAVVRTNGTASLGGIGTARGLAKLYAALVSPIAGNGPLFTPATVAAVSEVQTNGIDAVLGIHKAWSVGFHHSASLYPSLSARSFGHSGAGGQQSLVDPRHELSYAFLRRRFDAPSKIDPNHDRLLGSLRAAVDASR